MNLSLFLAISLLIGFLGPSLLVKVVGLFKPYVY